MIEQVLDVVPSSGKEVVDTEYLAAEFQQALAKMRAEESSAAANQNALFEMLHYFPRDTMLKSPVRLGAIYHMEPAMVGRENSSFQTRTREFKSAEA